ncbi:alkaline shock response membrane anchor protein AmaP [Bacillus safensis]|uniref:alkaline shock response membrane anchor protein AmaP n=1 Tax=Bacillus safensis TaxID=561879 RepID=UPI0022378122|nr:alkaline shock response membrane anchor protein AmaP [Bacillus safensis]MCW4645700.1 alkaline shock response membrane anchor protein AmaP [Bacillus safensis]MCY7564008.1 alkaline shock response membrane anchor protein AmaP [Bacillus safensis]MCY7633437.1 alkaline shock response membrane anchor protein AmaP [Bacillus safensis]MCY7647956.1 alkaline shock response membrane anchor protein AmaP [Bacillus safensis]MCY7652407.1 alkaline shock response membrane anchor protein AmaP [Bacillus safensi
MTHHVWQLFIIGGIMLICIIFRMNRMRRYQLVRPISLLMRMYVFGLTALILLLEGWQNHSIFIYAAIGMLFGSSLAVHAYETIRMKEENGRLYVKTSKWIESFILCLFLSRLSFKLGELTNHSLTKIGVVELYQHIVSDDAMTMLSFFLLAAYYVVFSYQMMKAGKRAAHTHHA